MSTGFLTNTAAVTGITTAYDPTKAIVLTSSDTVGNGGASLALPQAVYLDNLEIRVEPSGPGATSLTARITYDPEGDDPLTTDAGITLGVGITDTAFSSGLSLIQMWKRMPGKTLTLYLHIKTNADTVDVSIGHARLHWTSSFVPGVG